MVTTCQGGAGRSFQRRKVNSPGGSSGLAADRAPQPHTYSFSECLTGVWDSHQHGHSATPPNSQPRDTKQVGGGEARVYTAVSEACTSPSTLLVREQPASHDLGPPATSLPAQKPNLSTSATGATLSPWKSQHWCRSVSRTARQARVTCLHTTRDQIPCHQVEFFCFSR